MTIHDIIQLRLSNQGLAAPAFKTPADMVSWFGAVQAQDYPAARWGVAQRVEDLSAKEFDKAFSKGEILRTHVLRPTWHLVSPTDIRWMLQLTAPRIQKQYQAYYKKMELDARLLGKITGIFAQHLQGGRQLTRPELLAILEKSGITIGPDNIRTLFVFLYAELEGVVCSGALRGKQHTYALLEERVPKAETIQGSDALSRLATRYFQGHGPATVKDFAWWAGLTLTEAKRGTGIAAHGLQQEAIDGEDYYFMPPVSSFEVPGRINLLPNYDEYIVGYKDRDIIFNPKYAKGLDARNNPIFQHTIAIEGQICGTWKSQIKSKKAQVILKPFIRLSSRHRTLLKVATERYSQYLNIPVEWQTEHKAQK